MDREASAGIQHQDRSRRPRTQHRTETEDPHSESSVQGCEVPVLRRGDQLARCEQREGHNGEPRQTVREQDGRYRGAQAQHRTQRRQHHRAGQRKDRGGRNARTTYGKKRKVL